MGGKATFSRRGEGVSPPGKGYNMDKEFNISTGVVRVVNYKYEVSVYFWLDDNIYNADFAYSVSGRDYMDYDKVISGIERITELTDDDKKKIKKGLRKYLNPADR